MIGEVPQDRSQRRLLRREGYGLQPKEDDSRVWESTPKDKLAKVAVIGDEDALFVHCRLKDFEVGHPRPMVLRNRGNVVPCVPQYVGETSVGTFIEKEPHLSGRRLAAPPMDIRLPLRQRRPRTQGTPSRHRA